MRCDFDGTSEAFGLGVSPDGRLHLLSADDLTSAFFSNESVPARDVGEFFDELAGRITTPQAARAPQSSAKPVPRKVREIQ